MSVNSYPNSDLKQCIVSKLGRVHSAHTQGPGRAHTTPKSCTGRAGRRITAHWAPCRFVSSRAHACMQPPCRDTIFVSRYKTHVTHALGLVTCVARRVAHALGNIVARCYTPLRAGLAARMAMRAQALCRDTICCIVTQHQKWAVTHSSSPTHLFFIFIIFFSFVLLIVKPQNLFFFFQIFQ